MVPFPPPTPNDLPLVRRVATRQPCDDAQTKVRQAGARGAFPLRHASATKPKSAPPPLPIETCTPPELARMPFLLLQIHLYDVPDAPDAPDTKIALALCALLLFIRSGL